MRDYGAQAVKNSKYRGLVDMALDAGTPLRAVLADIREFHDPGFDGFGLTSLHAYAKEREAGMATEREESMADLGIDPATAARNDGHVLDYIIQKGFEGLAGQGEGQIKISDVFRAIDRKARILGAAYRGQTVWALLDSQKALLRVFELIYETVPRQYVDGLMKRCVQEGLLTPAEADGARLPEYSDGEYGEGDENPYGDWSEADERP